MNPKVGVVILTFNRLNLLKITLSKIKLQTFPAFEILVVDNFSTDGTQEYLKSLPNISSIFLDENLGPAGGFYEGIKYFGGKNNVDFVWIMDDDFFPLSSCLQELIKHTNNKKVVFPFIREKNFKSRRNPGWWGVLIPLSIIEKVGYPMKELFFWAEDTEYLQHRIRDLHKYELQWIPSAKGTHFTERINNFRQPWRYYYEIRNTLFLRMYVRKFTIARSVKTIKAWIFMFFSILLKENNKRMKMYLFMLGTIHGVLKIQGKIVDPKNSRIKNLKN